MQSLSTKYLWIGILLLLCSSCKDIGTQPGASLAPEDEAILVLVYSSYKVPEGFYWENLSNSSLYYENTISTTPPTSRGNTWIELSTDDLAQARAWSDSSNAYSSEHRVVTSVRETEKFFEFRRVHPLSGTWTILSRVHKRSYLAWSRPLPYLDGSVIGAVNKRPITQADVRTVAEYLWFIRNYEMGGAKVLSSGPGGLPGALSWEIIETQVSGGDWGMRDNIAVFSSVYNVDQASGEISYHRTLIKTLEGRQN